MVVQTDPVPASISFGEIRPVLRENMGMEVDLEHALDSIEMLSIAPKQAPAGPIRGMSREP